MDYDALQSEAEKLLSLLRDRQPGLSTWNGFLLLRLHNIERIARGAEVAG